MKDKAEKLTKTRLKKFFYKGISFEIEELTVEAEKLKVVVKASKNGVELPVNNPLYYINPPTIHNGKEDHKEALKEIVYQTVVK